MFTPKVKKILITTILIICAILWLAPLYFVIINACKTAQMAGLDKASAEGASIQQFFANVKTILTDDYVKYLTSFYISIIIVIFSLIGITFISAAAAWVLARTKSKASKIIFFIIVGSMIIPFQVVMLPLVRIFAEISAATGIELLKTPLGVIVAEIGFAIGFSVFMYHGFLRSVPYELEEAAEMDGASKFQIFTMVVFPVMKPITITLLILNGIFIWNDFLLPLMLLGQGGTVQTVPIAVSSYIGAYVKQWNLIMTSLVLTITPAMILYVVAQKHIVKGMTMGSVK